MNIDLCRALAKTLAVATFDHWPEECDEEPMLHRCFQEHVEEELSDAAELAGFEGAGVGNFTAVFTHDLTPGVVYKLNAGTTDEMQAYHEWLMDQTHENLPRVYLVEPFGRGCVAVSEELGSNGNGYQAKYGDTHPDLQKIVDELRPLLEGAGYGINDLHSANVMMRGDTIVVNDPCSVPKGHEESYSDEDDDLLEKLGVPVMCPKIPVFLAGARTRRRAAGLRSTP